jgi:hypothetical protein
MGVLGVGSSIVVRGCCTPGSGRQNGAYRPVTLDCSRQEPTGSLCDNPEIKQHFEPEARSSRYSRATKFDLGDCGPNCEP